MSSKNSKKIICASIFVIGGVLAYMYLYDDKTPVKPVNPVNPIIVNTAPVGHAGLEDFAFSNVKNSYVHDGNIEMALPGVVDYDNINGILTNFRGKTGEVLNIGQSQTNEADMGQRDPRAIEGYVMNEHHYGAGTPNYRALAGYY